MATKTLKVLFLCLIAVSFTMAAPTGIFASDDGDAKIVSVDLNRIMQQHPAFQQARQKLQGEMQQMRQKMQDMGEQEQRAAQQEFQQRGQDLQAEARDEVKKDVQKVADEKGYEFVVDSNALVAGGKDVTDEVIEALELEE
ncbi:MAG: OmpH family outer membrane protein [Thermodesulfobacteriota bacterium]